jgi:oligopeptidase B
VTIRRSAASRKIFFAPALFILLAIFIGQACSPRPPVAEKNPQKFTNFGSVRVDDYYWLKERDNPKVLAYLKAENEYLDKVMAPTKPLQDALYQEVVGRIKQDDSSVPYRLKGYYYYTRYETGKEYPLYCRKKGALDAPEEILLNVPAMAVGHEFFHVAAVVASPDSMLIAYGVDNVSRRKYTIHFKNLTTGEILPDELKTTDGYVVWANDNKTVFYPVKDDETLRSYKVMKHVLGTEASADKEVYNEADITYEIGVLKTKSDRFILIASGSTLSDEYRVLDADKPDGPWKVFQPRERDLKYDVDHLGDSFFVLTNWQAKNFRLMKTTAAKTGKDNWKEVIAHRADVLLEGFELFKNDLVLGERKDGLVRIRVMSWDKKADYYLDFGEQTYAAGLSYNPEAETDIVRYVYTSLTTPNSTYDFNMKTREKTLLKQEQVLGGFDSKNYFAERLWATAKDGVKVPISLVYRKGLQKNGENPLLLYGYGSYGASEDAGFWSPVISLLDRGFVYAIAHIRGGQEMGRRWYEDGKLLKKKNTFTDFIACAEYLVAEKYSSPAKMFASGASAGGLLMGAVTNMRPDLWKGVIAGVPYVDVINTMLDASIPLTTSEYDEWGNPNVKEYYDYMLSYSPYDQVAAKNYPAMLVTTGLHDSQVQYWEPAKWVAKLRAMKTDKNPLLLHTNMSGGHGGASGRFERYKVLSLEYAFMLDQLGIKK